MSVICIKIESQLALDGLHTQLVELGKMIE